MSVRILIGDCRETLKALPDQSVHCCVTSPPYFGLRDYGCDGQIGLEQTPEDFIAAMVEVFRAVRRVLREDGTVWLNLGDSYAGSGRGGNPESGTKQGTNKGSQTVGVLYGRENNGDAERARIKAQFAAERASGLKPKDLQMIPARVALALQADGWWLRSHIIWHKPNPMPESVSDRPTSSHESIFLLTKNERYFYDAAAVREEAVKTGTPGHLASGKASREKVRRTPGADKQAAMAANSNPSTERRMGGFNARWDASEIEGEVAAGRNLRNVWTVATHPYSGAHFATFPPALIEPCVKAGCPEGGTVLDPFGGAGTTGLVADRLGRNAILTELNPEYAEIARKRIADDSPLFSSVAIGDAA